MDAIELLTADHARVNALFREAENSDSAKKKLVFLKSIRDELITHMFIEETVFYPAFKKYDDFKDLLDRSYRDHAEVKNILRRVESLRDDVRQVQDTLDDLEDLFTRHMGQEESDFFPKARTVMRRPEREALGRHLETARTERSEKAA